MIANDSNTQNEAAYRTLKATIDQGYPKGHFVAIDNGQVVADAATLDELLRCLAILGVDPKGALAVQAGVDYPDYAFILLQGAE